MERITKALVILTTLLVAAALEVEGGRMLMKGNAQVDQPQNFYGGGAGGVLPGPGFAGLGFGPNGFYTFPGSGSSGLPTISSPPSDSGLPFISSPPSDSGLPFISSPPSHE